MTKNMKDSGVDWIGGIPENWNVIRVKNKFINRKQIVGENVDKYERLSLTLKGVLKRDKNDNNGLQPEKFESYQILKEDELVFKLIDLENVSTSRVGLSKYEGLVSPAYIILNNKQESKYGYYYFLSMWQREIFNKLGGVGVRSNLTVKDLLNIKYLDIPKNEKKEIVDYLDKKVPQIDEIIKITNTSIEEYKKYKYALITKCVTNGINKNIDMKSTDVDWIGQVPQKWKCMKLKYIFSIKKDIAGKEGFDILSVTQSGLKIKDISKNEGQISADYSKYQIVEKGDFVMNHMDLLTGWVDCSKYYGVTSPDYRVFKFKNPELYSPEYYTYIMQICYKNKIFYGLGQGVSNLGRWRLQTDKFLNFMLPVPPKDEQEQIVNYLDNKCIEIDNIIEQKQKLLVEMEAYKKSLIYECVTGKREVK
ncbi:restriction endonuclease subunit S [Clostridium septicum]|uniref:restriction endonuclease subunit S n=1 Tax=Clostridium septicum TaxID=1504 RepID=UPI00272EA44E|nr:restriction endonuclease subunit S [Clostridium septicum]WLF69371.1 restriction endonuclease subunit S [Clostridium septicum]